MNTKNICANCGHSRIKHIAKSRGCIFINKSLSKTKCIYCPCESFKELIKW